MTTLFDSIKVGALTLPNRMVMAPLTRGRAESDGTPTEIMVQYYRQRATAGLIISEATSISPLGVGWVNAPTIFKPEDITNWQTVTDAVHQAGGRIFLQLWHMGRVSHPDFLNGQQPVGPSAIAAQGESHTPQGKKPYVTPRELSVEEIRATVADYATATKNARSCGFDGVEIHGANGYLIDEFLRDSANQRNDEYGGAIPNRARFMLEVVEAVVSAWSADRVGIRLSPANPYNDMSDSDPIGLFTYAAEQLNKFELAYLHVLEGLPGSVLAGPEPRVTPHIRRAYNGILIVNGGYNQELGQKAIENNEADLIAYGTLFLANPDLVERFREGTALNTPDPHTFYTPGEKGYIDYPMLTAVA
ncbi:NADH:flavin oxidoreductase/NADH oxidase [Calothrix sp. NIES-4071]|nr:NADH:flavin oxidoreductase/NADH oxidase [Calothrix sp. NIES-4071]BAZ61236.1 NADH:flavin oxidoreductase/NADH oxidase [Calothrix sp. NIES-4105]